MSGEYLAHLKATRPDVDWDAAMADAHVRRAHKLQALGLDELDDYLAEQMEDPRFRAAYEAAERRHRRAHAGPLAVDGHEYRRRSLARRRR